METLETEKHELELKSSGGAGGSNSAPHGQDRINALEQELAQSKDQLAQAQRELINLQSQLRSANKDPVPQAGPVLSKSRSLEVSRLITPINNRIVRDSLPVYVHTHTFI